MWLVFPKLRRDALTIFPGRGRKGKGNRPGIRELAKGLFDQRKVVEIPRARFLNELSRAEKGKKRGTNISMIRGGEPGFQGGGGAKKKGRIPPQGGKGEFFCCFQTSVKKRPFRSTNSPHQQKRKEKKDNLFHFSLIRKEEKKGPNGPPYCVHSKKERKDEISNVSLHWPPNFLIVFTRTKERGGRESMALRSNLTQKKKGNHRHESFHGDLKKEGREGEGKLDEISRKGEGRCERLRLFGAEGEGIHLPSGAVGEKLRVHEEKNVGALDLLEGLERFRNVSRRRSGKKEMRHSGM